MNQATINFELYEDVKNFLGLASVALPNLNWLTVNVTGAGLAGNIEAAIKGHTDAMSTTINFRNWTPEAVRLQEPRRHTIDLRVALQEENAAEGTLEVKTIKHVMVVVPKTLSGGNIAPASTGDASGEYAVHYWATWINGKKVLEIDPLNYICYINGTDYLADVRAALGKS